MSYVAPQKVFGHIDRLAGWAAGWKAGLGDWKPAPVTIEWDLSNACSLGCRDCHFAHTHTAGPWAAKNLIKPAVYSDTGKFADADLVVRALGEAKTAGVKGIVWTGGGEPTLHPDWPAIIGHAQALGLEQGMYTLGGHLDEAHADILGHAATWVVVSLDAIDADTYGRDKGVPNARFGNACAGIQRLAKTPATVGVSFLLHATNWFDAPQMLKFAAGLGATYVTFRPTIHTAPDHPGRVLGDRSWITHALPLLTGLKADPRVEVDPDRFAQYRDWQAHPYPTCYGIRLSTTITPDGRVWVCPQRRGVAGSELGDLRVESFRDIWRRHPGKWTDLGGCRAMCRLHLLNQQLIGVFEPPREHAAFV